MDANTARAKLGFMLASDTAPVISGAMLDALLADAQRQDKYGRYPTDANWLPTYDLHASAAEGWRWKAAQLAGSVNISSDGTSINRGSAFMHAEKMETLHRRRIRSASVRVQGETANLFDRAQAIYDLSQLGN